MNIIGIRVEPQKSTFVVLNKNNEDFEVINIEKIKVPSALDIPERLKYIRNCILDILHEYEIEYAGIRVAEGNTQNLNIDRLHIEGVIQEAFSSSLVKGYFVGRKKSIASRMGIKTTALDNLFKGSSAFTGISNWSQLTNNVSREAALVAVGAVQ